jgi:hypothetical protein
MSAIGYKMEGLSYGHVLVCVNGHVFTAKANYDEIPDKFCARCGDKIINKCLACGTHLRGTPRTESQLIPPFSYFGDPYVLPSYCTNCGSPHPWTKRGEEAAYELIESSTLTPQEKEDWKQTIPALVQDSPRASAAIVKFKAYAAKAGIEIGKAVKEIVIGVVSEVIKNSLLK